MKDKLLEPRKKVGHHSDRKYMRLVGEWSFSVPPTNLGIYVDMTHPHTQKHDLNGIRSKASIECGSPNDRPPSNWLALSVAVPQAAIELNSNWLHPAVACVPEFWLAYKKKSSSTMNF